MKLDNFLRFNGMFGGFGLIFASGSFGIIDKVTDYEVSEENGVKSYFFKCKGVSFTTAFLSVKTTLKPYQTPKLK